MSRLSAFVRHLLLSTVIVSGVFAVVFLLWYPTPFFSAVGAWNIIRIMIGVDLVVGPLLTLIVFKPGKRLLIVDVVFIAIVQVSAMIYGASVLYQERPIYAVFSIDRFHILAEQDIPEEARIDYPWIAKPASGPLMASARLPESVEEQQRIMEETVFGGAPDIEQRPWLWVPYEQDIAAVISAAYPIQRLRMAAETTALVDRTITRIDINEAQLGFLPIISAKNDACVIVDLRDGRLLAVIDIDPWQILK